MKCPSPVKTQAAPGGNATGSAAPSAARGDAFAGATSRGVAPDNGVTTRVHGSSFAVARGFRGPDRAFFWRDNSLRRAV
jgi:hypothetical protein